MTDKLHYQDVFKTNIPTLEQEINVQTSYLFGAVHDPQFEDLPVFKHLRPPKVDNADVFQAFWELKGEDGRVQRMLALTASKNGVVIGIDRRPTTDRPEAFRKSLWWGNTVYDSDPGSPAFHGSSEEQEVASFYEAFYDTTASLGLHHRLQEVLAAHKSSQNESTVESFASAA